MNVIRHGVPLLHLLIISCRCKYEMSDGTVGSMTEISSMVGSSVSLPCNMSSNIPGDRVRLVLWFREDKMTPIYTLDSREKPLGEARHWSDDTVFEGRAFYQAAHNPGRLVINSVSIYDQTLYKCRVDFKVQPTTISQVQLNVNTPPGKPVIYNEAGVEVRLKLGPYKLGESVMIKCLVVGGRPSPEVTWWRDHHLVDDSYTQASEFRVENMLTFPNLQRSDVNSILTCQAKNNNNSVPVSTSVKLDMTYGPETLNIRGVHHSLSSGERYFLECEAIGSRPVPVITWTLGDTDVTSMQTKLVNSNDNNITVSTISLHVDSSLNGQTITCSAMVHGLPSSSITSSSSLNVHFISKATLSLGSSMTPETVKEGDDVYLECQVDANPRPHKITWYKDGEIVKQDVSQGIILSNLTLVIQHVTRDTRGHYTCVAANSEGSVNSNVLSLDIQYSPVCSQNIQQKYEVELNVQSEVVCNVDAAPNSNLTFHWVFKTTKEMIDIQQAQMRYLDINNNQLNFFQLKPLNFRVNGSQSKIDYVPRTKLDYGTLLCWAENNIGTQSDPCVFHLVPVQPPPPINDCSIINRDVSSVGIKCFAQSRHTLINMTFVLELWRTGEEAIIRNMTGTSGDWSLGGLTPGQEYKISVWTMNDAGFSSRYNSTFVTHKSEYAESRIHIDTAKVSGIKFSITPILGALIGVGVALSFVTITILIVVYCKNKTRNPHGSRDSGETRSEPKELLSPDMAPRKILCDVDDESGFEQLYSDTRYSSFNRQLCNKNIFIVTPSQSAKQTQDGFHNNFSISRSRSQFNSLQHCKQREPRQYDSPQLSCCNTYKSVRLQRNNCRSPASASVNTECKYQFRSCDKASDSSQDEEIKVPLLSPISASISSGPTISTMSSTISSSELNHSLTSSDTSEFTSERDRESEV